MEAENLNYKSLKWPSGKTQLPGIKPKVFYIPKRAIVVFPSLAKTFNLAMGELVTYTDSFQLAAGEYWRELSTLADKSPLDGKGQGTKPSKTFLNQLVISHEGVEEDASAFAMEANNDDFVYLVPTKNGKYRVIGNEMFQTDTAIEQKIGAAPTDEMGTMLTITCTDVAPGLYYAGEIVTEDGIINEVEGKVATPAIAPAGGTIDAGTDTVAVTSATAASTIKYKLDGGAWTTYTGAISTAGWAAGNHTLWVQATKAGMFPSLYSLATFFVE